MHINNDGLKLIKSFEGCSLKSYKLNGEKYYTIGYGHSFDSKITATTIWTQEQCDKALTEDLKSFEESVDYYSKIYGFKFNENQFSALVSYAYNRGKGGLKQLLSNSKTIKEISTNIVVYWGSAERYKNGLVRRRKAEKELFDKVTISYFKKYTGNSDSIVKALESIGAKSDKEYRAKIAKANGIKNYTYTAEQNTKMLNLLKKGKLIKP